MHQTYSNPFKNAKTFSTSYVHSPTSNNYFPNPQISPHDFLLKPSFLISPPKVYPPNQAFIISPFHDYRSWGQKRETMPVSKGYKQNPFYRSHILEDTNLLPTSAGVHHRNHQFLPTNNELPKELNSDTAMKKVESSHNQSSFGLIDYGAKMPQTLDAVVPQKMDILVCESKVEDCSDIFEKLRQDEESYIIKLDKISDSAKKKDIDLTPPSFNQKNMFKTTSSGLSEDHLKVEDQEPSSPKWSTMGVQMPSIQAQTQTQAQTHTNGPQLQFHGKKFYRLNIQQS